MKLGRLLALTAAAGFFAATAIAAGTKVVYCKVPTAQIRDGKTPSSAVVAEVQQGAKMTVIEEDGVRYVVQLDDGRKGYISRLSVSDEKPRQGGGTGGMGIVDDRAMTERSTAASGRGLSEAAKQMGGKVDPAAVGSVEKMEAMAAKISKAEVERFRKEGGLQ